MARRPHERGIAKTAIRSHGWMLIGTALATIAIAGHVFLQVPSRVPPWDEHGLLAAVGILSAVLGVAAIRSAGSWQRGDPDQMLPPSSDAALGAVLSASAALLATALLRPTFGFIFDFLWRQLASSPFWPQSDILPVVAFHVLALTIMVWAVAAVLTPGTAGVALPRHVGALEVQRRSIRPERLVAAPRRTKPANRWTGRMEARIHDSTQTHPGMPRVQSEGHPGRRRATGVPRVLAQGPK